MVDISKLTQCPCGSNNTKELSYFYDEKEDLDIRKYECDACGNEFQTEERFSKIFDRNEQTDTPQEEAYKESIVVENILKSNKLYNFLNSKKNGGKGTKNIRCKIANNIEKVLDYLYCKNKYKDILIILSAMSGSVSLIEEHGSMWDMQSIYGDFDIWDEHEVDDRSLADITAIIDYIKSQ